MFSDRNSELDTSFVVRNDASHASIVVQLGILSYQAANLWGGYNLDRGLIGGGSSVPKGATYEQPSVYDAHWRAYVVSFDRPYYDYDGDAGLGDFARYDYATVRWLERQGYDLSYQTDIDTDAHGALLQRHKLVIVPGHSAYWSTAMRTAAQAARDAGTSLAFFGAEDVLWHVRLQPSSLGADREVVCYKPGYFNDKVKDHAADTDPSLTTVQWRDPPLDDPENSLLGEMGAGAVPVRASLVLAAGASPFVKGTGLGIGSNVPGLLALAFDSTANNGKTPQGLTEVMSSPVPCARGAQCRAGGQVTAYATLYTATSGAKVFDAGTLAWPWGLDNDNPFIGLPAHSQSTSAFQHFTANLIAYLE